MLNAMLLARARTIAHSRLFSGGLWAVGGKVFVLPLGLVSSILLARVLSPDDMGGFVFAQSIVLSGVVVAQLGLGPTAVRMIAGALGTGDIAGVRDSIRNLLQWGVIGALVTAIVLNVAGDLIGLQPTVAVWASLWVIVLALQKLLAEILRGFHDIRAAALIGDASAGGLVSYIVSTIMLFIVWQFYGRIGLPDALMLTAIAGTTAIALALVLLVRTLKTLGLPRGEASKHFSWRFLLPALPVLVHTLATLLQSQFGIWILEAVQPSSEVALYGVAARVVALIAVPLGVVNSVVSPIIPDLFWQGETGKLERILRGLTTLSTLPAVAALVAFVIAGPFLLGLLFGDFYRAANEILVLLTVGAVFNVMAGSGGLTLIMTGHQNTLMVISIVTGIVTVVAVFLVVEPFGAAGVASAVSAGLLMKNLLIVYFNKRLSGMWTHLTLRFNRRVISDLLS